jgi:hypothetical protein
MARNYGTKQKVILWDVFDGIVGDGDGEGAAVPLELNSENLGFDPQRRALYITMGGATGDFGTGWSGILQVQGYEGSDGTTAEWINVGWKKETLTTRDITGENTYVIDVFDDIMRVKPRAIRIGMTTAIGSGDPGTVAVTVTAKRVPSNMRDE